MGRSWQTLNFKTNKICQQYSVLAFRTANTVVFGQVNSKAPKAEQVFPYAICNNHSFVVFFVDRSIMKLMLVVTVWKISIVGVDAQY